MAEVANNNDVQLFIYVFCGIEMREKEETISTAYTYTRDNGTTIS